MSDATAVAPISSPPADDDSGVSAPPPTTTEPPPSTSPLPGPSPPSNSVPSSPPSPSTSSSNASSPPPSSSSIPTPLTPPPAANNSPPPASHPPPPLTQPPPQPDLPPPPTSNGKPTLPPPPPNLPSPSPPAAVVFPPPSSKVSPPAPTPPVIVPSPPLPLTPPAPSQPSPPILSPPPVPTSSPPEPVNSSKPPHSAGYPAPSNSLEPPSPSGGSSSSSESLVYGVVAVLAAVGILSLVLGIALVFCLLRKKRKENPLGSAAYTIPPDKSRQQAKTNGSTTGSDLYYSSKPVSSPGTGTSSYVSHGSYPYYGMKDTAISKLSFAYEELRDITGGFSQENLLGQGGFGSVYKGCLQDGRIVAVKQLKAGGGQGEREFKAEVEIISRVHHRHLVSLVGYCVAENHRLLVYEFVPNKTLEYHLHGTGLPVMDWTKRLKIAVGSARGLAYLHEDCHPRIIHRDIKSANILLDNNFEAQVADFGLAKLTNDTNTHVSTRVMGTFGYMAPEYATSGKLTDRSDVFSFGVVLLELLTGRKPIDPTQPLGEESLVEWARPILVHAVETGDYKELVDPRLDNNFVESEVLRMIEAAAACVRHSASKRPRMVQVLRALDNEREMPDLSNGVKFGQSTVYNSSQYSADIENFRRMAFGAEEFSISYNQTGQSSSQQSGDVPVDTSSREFTSGESPTSYKAGGSSSQSISS